MADNSPIDESNSGAEDATSPNSKLVSGWDDDGDDNNNEKANQGDDSEFDEYCSVLDDFGCEAYEELARNLDEKVYRWIRVEAREDETLADVKTKQDVMLKIERVRTSQSTCGPCQLYERTWEEKTAATQPVNGDRPVSFSVLQFNALAEGLSSGPNVKTPFPVENQKEDSENNKQKDPGYGGFTQVTRPEICLDFNLRRWRLLEVILGFTSIDQQPDSTSGNKLEGVFDVLALEEIDRFRGFFLPMLRIFGYDGLFMPKSKAPGVPLGYYSDGCALFWKSEVFELVSEERIKYKVGNQVVILAELKHKLSGVHILLAVTHLKAQKSETNEKIRCRQVEEMLQCLQATADKSTTARGVHDMPVLIMGDFNADPPAHIQFPDSSIERVLRNHMSTIENDDKPQPMRFQSAYAVDPPDEGLFTTWKTRGTNTVQRIIDYIFHSEQLTCTATLSLPKEKELEDSKLPGLRYPSDHLMVAAKFEVVHDKQSR